MPEHLVNFSKSSMFSSPANREKEAAKARDGGPTIQLEIEISLKFCHHARENHR